MDIGAELKTAERHAAAIVLLGLEAAQRGWATLEAHDPLMHHGVDVARSEAEARGVAANDITTTPIGLHQTVQELGSQGVDPHVVASETKSEKKAEEEAAESNKPPEQREEEAKAADDSGMPHVAENAHEPPPPGAVREEPGAIANPGTTTGPTPGHDLPQPSEMPPQPPGGI